MINVNFVLKNLKDQKISHKASQSFPSPSLDLSINDASRNKILFVLTMNSSLAP